MPSGQVNVKITSIIFTFPCPGGQLTNCKGKAVRTALRRTSGVLLLHLHHGIYLVHGSLHAFTASI